MRLLYKSNDLGWFACFRIQFLPDHIMIHSCLVCVFHYKNVLHFIHLTIFSSIAIMPIVCLWFVAELLESCSIDTNDCWKKKSFSDQYVCTCHGHPVFFIFQNLWTISGFLLTWFSGNAHTKCWHCDNCLPCALKMRPFSFLHLQSCFQPSW